MLIKTEKKTYDITLKKWEGWRKCKFAPDQMALFTADFPENEDGIKMTSEEELKEMLKRVRREIYFANAGKNGEHIQALSTDEISASASWTLWVNKPNI